ncbi:hypothetical protein [Nocardia sp. XZ_19_385]|uniref:hypothetical protein n=1 Tax=Nocardia sp. XZ_19_385 TaxID=2769488 RepID=UPI001E387C9C|nr:hypothetical protein [Nocardia sp. XZ_19_385]
MATPRVVSRGNRPTRNRLNSLTAWEAELPAGGWVSPLAGVGPSTAKPKDLWARPGVAALLPLRRRTSVSWRTSRATLVAIQQVLLLVSHPDFGVAGPGTCLVNRL